MNLDLLQNLQVNKNRLLRSGTQLLTTAPSDPVVGETLFFDSGASSPLQLSVYDGVSQGTPASTWRLLAGSNRNDTVTGLWAWNPAARGAGTGAGDRAPFTLGLQSQWDSSSDAVRLSNYVVHLNADLVDGRHVQEWANAVPSGVSIPVYSSGGLLRCADPLNDYDAVNRKTMLAATTGLVALTPCRAATVGRFGGTRSSNTITASSNGVFTCDGVAVIVGDRVLLKDQQTGGSGVDNGVYTVTTVGTAGTPAVLTRASDADATGELIVGALVFIEQGATNMATQWSCQRPTGVGGGSVITINTDVQLWQKTFQQSAYSAGRGMVLSGLEFNFCQNLDYTRGSIFTATAARTIAEVKTLADGVVRFLGHTSLSSDLPLWTAMSIAFIADWPNPILPGPSGTAKRHARFGAVARTIEDSNLEDNTTSVFPHANNVLTPTIGLGDITHPFGILWTSALRLKPTAASTATGALGTLLGTQSTAVDSNTDHKSVVTFAPQAVKDWLAITPGEINAVPKSTTLTFSDDGLVQVLPAGAQDLSQNRTWAVSLNTSTLDTRWVTLDTPQSIIATKRFWNSSPSTNVIEVATAAAGQPNLRITAGASVIFGDGTNPPTATIDYDAVNTRLRVSGKPVEFATTAIVKMTSALASSGAPISILGLNASDEVRRVSLSDLGSFTGVPSLAQNAVGYGDATGKLTGVAADLYWDYTNKRLGLKVTPSETLDVVGTFRLTNTTTTASLPGGQIYVTDTSALQADWTNRNLYGLFVSATKSGAAPFGTSANMHAIAGTAVINNGSVTGLIGVRANINIGAAAGGPTVNNVWAFYSTSATPAGTAGTISSYTHFHADSLATMPQPGDHYGFRCVNQASGTGAARTAGIRLDLVSTGVGQRFNIYAPGDAVSYFAGPIGLGVVLTPAVTSPPSAITPTARLEFAVGTATLAPMRFAPASAIGSLLSPPLAGHLESTGDRLYFTDTAPSRHALAFYDDAGFTNDSSATPLGGVMFDQSGHMMAPLDPANSIGQGDFTLWARFRMPASFRGPNVEGVCSVCASSATNSTYNNAAKIAVGSAGQVYFYISVDASNYRVLKTTGLFFTVYGGKNIDVVVVRKGSAAPTLYVNGVAQTVTDTPGGASPPTWDMAVNSSYLHAGLDATGGGSVPEISRVAFFNYAMSQTEVTDVSRQGRVAAADRWGSMSAMTVTNGGFETFSSGTPTGWTKGASVTTADEAVDFHGGAHAVRFTAGGLPASTSANWLYLSSLFPLKRHLVRAWAKRVSGTGNLSIGAGYQAVALGAMFGTISSAATWTQFGGVGRAEGGQTGGLYNTYLTLAGWTAGDVWLVDDVTAQQVGAVADMDFTIGCGTVIPDRSGRYPGTMTGFYEHVINTCPLEVTSGSGTIARNLRRYTETITAKDGDTKTITHSLSTTNLTVMVWNTAGASVAVAVNRKTGFETTAVEIGFSLVGAPSTPVSFLVVIIG